MAERARLGGAMNRGDVFWYTFREPDKRRPVLILTRNLAIPYLTSVTVAPLTTRIRNIPSEVLLIPEEDGVLTVCVANMDNLQTVPKQQIGSLITSLTPDRMNEVAQALSFALALDSFMGP